MHRPDPGWGFKAEGLPRLIAPPAGDAYDHIESARGSLGVFLVSDGSPRPYRMKVRSPAFCRPCARRKACPRAHACPTSSSFSGRSTLSLGRSTDERLPVGTHRGPGGGLLIAVAALIGVWAERKVAARIQMRLGPQEAGPFGLLQTLADTVKLVLKEDITPTQADTPVFRIAPLLVFVPVASSLAVIPFAAGWAPFNIASGVLFFLAVPAISVIGMLIAGWSSRNSYASIGGVRGAAQMISYELPRTLSVLALCLLAGLDLDGGDPRRVALLVAAAQRHRLPRLLHRLARRAQSRPVRPVGGRVRARRAATSPTTRVSAGLSS